MHWAGNHVESKRGVNIALFTFGSSSQVWLKPEMLLHPAESQVHHWLQCSQWVAVVSEGQLCSNVNAKGRRNYRSIFARQHPQDTIRRNQDVQNKKKPTVPGRNGTYLYPDGIEEALCYTTHKQTPTDLSNAAFYQWTINNKQILPSLSLSLFLYV